MWSKKEKNIHKKKSYSQCGEDLIVNFIFNALKVNCPTYLDVGAHSPFYLNNTAIFYEKGSRGVNVEADPELYKQFEKHRNKDNNLNIGVGLENGVENFYIINVPSLNTFSKKVADSYVEKGNFYIDKIVPINLMTINDVIFKYMTNQAPDFLSVDVEGLDEKIIKSMDFDEFHPKVICIETLEFETSGFPKKNKGIITFLESKGYFVYADTFINTIFVSIEAWKNKDNI